MGKELFLFKKINRHGNIGSSLEFRSKRRWEIASGGYDSRVFLSDFSNALITNEFLQGQEEVGINAPFVTALKFKGDGDLLGIGRFNGIIQIQESKGGSRKKEKWEGREIRGHRYAVMDLDYYKDFMISTGLDGALNLWNLNYGDVPSKRESVEFDGYKFNSLSVLKNGALDTDIKVAVGGFTLKEYSQIFIHNFQI
jgi:WD40 repeat protein